MVDGRQLRAIEIVENTAETLVNKHPEIAEAYRGGRTQPDIAKELVAAFPSVTSPDLLRRAVQLAITTLIPDDDERKAIAKKHNKTRGETSFKKKEGIHGQSLDDQQKLGRASHEEQTGLFALDPDDLRRRVADKTRSILWEGIYNKGGVSLVNRCLALSTQPDFLHQQGNRRGWPDLEKITEKLQEEFGDQLKNPLEKSKVRYCLHRYKKRRTAAAVAEPFALAS